MMSKKRKTKAKKVLPRSSASLEVMSKAFKTASATPKKGSVSRPKLKLTIQKVKASGRGTTSPVTKYFFMAPPKLFSWYHILNLLVENICRQLRDIKTLILKRCTGKPV